MSSLAAGPGSLPRPAARSRAALAVLLALVVALTAMATLTPASATNLTVQKSSAVAAAAKAARPAVTKVSPAKGLVTGGTKVTVRGKNFKKVKSVTIGGRRATNVRVVGPTKIIALSPQGFVGKVNVTVATRAGRSKAVKASKFTYKDPATASRYVVVPKQGVVTGTDVAWVTSTDPDGGPAPDSGPWLVGINAGGAVPAVGDGYYLPAGTPAFLSGLAGRVAVVASQPDGVTTVTVDQEPVSELMDSINSVERGPGLGTEITSAKPGAAADAAPRTTTALRSEGTGSFNFPSMPSSFFACRNSANEAASFGGSLNLSFSNTRHDFAIDKGSLFAKPYISAWIRTDITVTGKVSSTGKITCKIRDDWAKSNQRVFAIGAFVVKIKPEASFTISGTTTLKISQTTRRMVGFAVFNNRPTIYNTRVNLGLRVDAIDLSAKVEASAGMSVRILYLGTVGGELQALLAANGKITAKARPRQACVDLELGVKFVGSLVIDLWFKDWKPVSYSKLFPFAEWHKCTPPTTDTPVTDPPTIATTRLPNARRNASYAATLETADNRNGTWALQTDRFPIGLTLDNTSGRITGIPTAGIGDYRFLVTFTDTNGLRTAQNVSLYVGPPAPVGGGDFQATLTWGHFADMDLYVTDPAGETIYYGNGTSETGGQLDRDANAGCGEQNASPVENVFWPPSGAPTGIYLVRVDTYSPCGTVAQPWRLTVRVRGVVVLDTSGNGDSDSYEVNVTSARARVVGRQPAPQFRGPSK